MTEKRMKVCKDCEREKSIEEFHKTSGKRCKECHREVVRAGKQHKNNEEIAYLLDLGIIYPYEIAPAKLLIDSALSALDRTKYNANYAHVEFLFDSYMDMVIKIITVRTPMWIDWKEQYEVYVFEDFKKNIVRQLTV